MIACTSLIRVDLARIVTKLCANSKSVRKLQIFSFHRTVNRSLRVGVEEVLSREMNRSRGKKVSSVWRRVSTQSSSSQEFGISDVNIDCENSVAIAAEEKNEVESQVKEVHDGSFECENEVEIGDDQKINLWSIKRSGEVKGLEGEPITSTEMHAASIKPTSATAKHSISLQVGPLLMRFIKEKGGATQRKVEEEMGVQIIFPSSKMEETIIIEGDSAESVTEASKRIQDIIDEAVKSPSLDYSHFVSLPLAIHPQLVDRLVQFQTSILGISDTDQELGIERSIFINPKTFHLTVLMLKLWNQDLVRAAADVLQSVSSKVIEALDSRPVSIQLKGLECMRGSFAKARVLYAPVEEIGGEERLLRACQVIIDAFVEAGLVLEKDAKRELKLHATVMNARHRKRKGSTWKVDFFDARGIVDKYGSEDWGVYLIREAHLSQRFRYNENGYYHCCTSIPFPGDVQLD